MRTTGEIPNDGSSVSPYDKGEAKTAELQEIVDRRKAELEQLQHKPVERPVVNLDEPRTTPANPMTEAEIQAAKKAAVDAAEFQQKKQLHARVDRDFKYYAPTEAQVAVYGEIRDGARIFAHNLVTLCPHGRELHTALTLLEQAVMMANAAVARGGA